MSAIDNRKYAGIMNLPHHVSPTRPQMPMSDRAAQFSPFAALTGYAGVIRETARLTDRKIELDETMPIRAVVAGNALAVVVRLVRVVGREVVRNQAAVFIQRRITVGVHALVLELVPEVRAAVAHHVLRIVGLLQRVDDLNVLLVLNMGYGSGHRALLHTHQPLLCQILQRKEILPITHFLKPKAHSSP